MIVTSLSSSHTLSKTSFIRWKEPSPLRRGFPSTIGLAGSPLLPMTEPWTLVHLEKIFFFSGYDVKIIVDKVLQIQRSLTKKNVIFNISLWNCMYLYV
jgi:hypothetical protein